MYVWVVLATRSFPFLIQEIILKILWQSLIYWSVFVCLKIKNVCCGRSILFDYLWIIIQLAQFTVWTWLHDTIPTLPMLILNIKLEMIIKKNYTENGFKIYGSDFIAFLWPITYILTKLVFHRLLFIKCWIDDLCINWEEFFFFFFPSRFVV